MFIGGHNMKVKKKKKKAVGITSLLLPCGLKYRTPIIGFGNRHLDSLSLLTALILDFYVVLLSGI